MPAVKSNSCRNLKKRNIVPAGLYSSALASTTWLSILKAVAGAAKQPYLRQSARLKRIETFYHVVTSIVSHERNPSAVSSELLTYLCEASVLLDLRCALGIRPCRSLWKAIECIIFLGGCFCGTPRQGGMQEVGKLYMRRFLRMNLTMVMANGRAYWRI